MKEDINGKIAAVRAAISDDDTDRIKSSMEELNTALQAVGQAVYSQQSGAQASADDVEDATTTDDSDGDDDGTVEGEFREVR